MLNIYLGTNKKVFDAELYAIGVAPSIALKGEQRGWEGASHETTARWN